MTTEMRQASRLVETARREPLGMSLTLRHDLDAEAGLAGEPFEKLGEGLAGTLQPGRNEAAGDDGRLQETQVVAGVVEDFAQIGDVGRGFQVHAGEPKDRLIDDAHPRFDGGARLRIG